MKCFVVSLHRSGTLSAINYLNWLGIPARHWPTEHDGVNLEDKIAGRETDHHYVIDVLSPVLESFRAVADVPIPVLYRELFTRYPQAQFILVYRSAFDWVRSIRAHHTHVGDFRPFARVMYWEYFDWRPRSLNDLSDAELIWMHGQHTADVIAFFMREAPANLGVFDLYESDIGAKIAAFLGIKSDLTFPHFNSLSEYRAEKDA